MSQENVEVVRQLGEVWNESGFQGVVDQGLLHPDIEYHDDRRWPEARSAFGIAAFLERFDEFLEVFGEDARTTTEQVLDAGGDRVALIFRLTGRGRASGIPMTIAGATCAVSVTARSTSCRFFWTPTKPSKPPGCGSRAGPRRRRS